MSSDAVVDREAMTAAFDALDAALDVVAALDFDPLTTPERFGFLERCERVRRRLPTMEHPLINQLARQATPEELGGKLSHAIAEWMLISRGEASRRIKEAADLGPRQALTGEPLPPILAGTAAAQREGKLGAGQVAVIRRFITSCPAGSMPPPATKPKPNWPSRAASFVPNSSPRWPIRWPTASTPTAPTATRTAPGGAA